MLDGLPELGVFAVLAHAQTAFRPWLELGGTLLSSLELDPVVRELAILQVAHSTDADYEWAQHEAIAGRVGATGPQIEAVRAGRLDDPSLGEVERAALAFTLEAVDAGAASGPTLDRLLALSSPRQVVELLLVVGFYDGVAVLTRSCGLPIDAPARAMVDEGARQGGRP
ncbi:MAG: carboxymuconolactone decarboxylase family protein [Solirubrobacterales bacterium]